jgi:hypothetical protein
MMSRVVASHIRNRLVWVSFYREINTDYMPPLLLLLLPNRRPISSAGDVFCGVPRILHTFFSDMANWWEVQLTSTYRPILIKYTSIEEQVSKHSLNLKSSTVMQQEDFFGSKIVLFFFGGGGGAGGCV